VTQRFEELPESEQRAITAAGQHMTRLAYEYATVILIGASPEDDGHVNHGSGFLVRLGARLFLGTAAHVLAQYEKRLSQGEDVVFEAGQVAIDPKSRIRWRDDARDVVFLEVTSAEAARMGVWGQEPGSQWPPAQPAIGSYVVLSGYPAETRKRLSATGFEFPAFSVMLQVSSASEGRIVCQFTRENWISFGHQDIPAPGTNFGGMSGAPVLAIYPLSYPLIGLVTQFHSSFELLYISTFEDLPTQFPEASMVGPAA
jgi:hypothetical protein